LEHRHVPDDERRDRGLVDAAIVLDHRLEVQSNVLTIPVARHQRRVIFRKA
jgi:hypothetical protein